LVGLFEESEENHDNDSLANERNIFEKSLMIQTKHKNSKTSKK